MQFYITQENIGKNTKGYQESKSIQKEVCMCVSVRLCLCVCEREISVHAFFYQATNLLEGFLKAH